MLAKYYVEFPPLYPEPDSGEEQLKFPSYKKEDMKSFALGVKSKWKEGFFSLK